MVQEQNSQHISFFTRWTFLCRAGNAAAGVWRRVLLRQGWRQTSGPTWWRGFLLVLLELRDVCWSNGRLSTRIYVRKLRPPDILSNLQPTTLGYCFGLTSLHTWADQFIKGLYWWCNVVILTVFIFSVCTILYKVEYKLAIDKADIEVLRELEVRRQMTIITLYIEPVNATRLLGVCCFIRLDLKGRSTFSP